MTFDLRNTELKTVSKLVSSKVSGITLGGQVPANMKRWVTFLAVDGITTSKASALVLHVASVPVAAPTAVSLVATTNRKLFIPLYAILLTRSSKKLPIMEPASGPDPDKPIFSIAESKWLGVYASLTTVNVTVQYFDE